MRKALMVLLALLLTALSVMPASAQTGGVGVEVDGTALTFDVAPFIEDGRTLVPVRALAEALGFIVDYDAAERRVILQKDELVIQLWIDSDRVKVGDTEGKIDVAPKIKDGRTFLPFRYIGERLGAHVDWDQERRTATLTSPPPTETRALIGKALQSAGRHPAVKISGRFETAINMGGFVLSMPADVSLHRNGSDILGSLIATLPPMVQEKPYIQGFAVKEGLIYLLDPETAQWEQSGSITAEALDELLTGNQKLQPAEIPPGFGIFLELANVQANLLTQAIVLNHGQEEIEGVSTTKVTVSPALTGLGHMPAQFLDSLGLTAEQVGGASFSVQRLALTFWIEPDGFIRRSAVDLAIVPDQSVPGAAGVSISAAGLINFTPTSDPVPFPELP